MRGVSGFLADELPKVNSINFKRLCHAVADYSKGKLLSFEEPYLSRNFFKAELDMVDRRAFILLNSSYPFVAFASSVQYFDIAFVDDSLSSVIDASSSGFKVLTVNTLKQRLVIDKKTHALLNENNLNKAELDQILYWKPKTVGDVIFNFWD
ncbi:hypothetical protein [Paenibacillus sp. MMO-58]|uniref:hypothetical protein n=1 Tax=Paenibacillus sp. MMO-58 TaxID=3081290 RepID=UPI0030176203